MEQSGTIVAKAGECRIEEHKKREWGGLSSFGIDRSSRERSSMQRE